MILLIALFLFAGIDGTLRPEIGHPHVRFTKAELERPEIKLIQKRITDFEAICKRRYRADVRGQVDVVFAQCGVYNFGTDLDMLAFSPEWSAKKSNQWLHLRFDPFSKKVELYIK
jgi:hypothetical protein